MSVSTNQASSISSVFEAQKVKSLAMRLESLKERKERLKELGEFILSKRDRIQAAVHQDLKKSFIEVDLSEIYPIVNEIRHTLEHLDEWTKPKKIDAPITYLGTRSEIKFEPKGVCLIIAPWNYPFSLCFGPLVSCLAAGNTAIIKPSEMTPATSQLIAELTNEFFEEDIVKVFEGDQQVSTELLQLPFDHIFFTGSPAVGKIIMRAAAENLTSVTLELGGKSPTIIDETALISTAAKRIAFGKFLNNGQTCIAPDYILVHERVKDDFIASLKKQVVEMFGEAGKLNEDSMSYSRIVSQKHFKRLNQMVENAISDGAKVEFSGPVNENTLFIHPVLLSNVSLQSKLMEEEIFGPVLPIVTYRSEEEVIDLINSRQKPLALYVFSERSSFQKKVLSSTSAGTACINECVIQFTHANLPFGGVNNSGIGKSHGHAGFLEFSNQKSVLKQLTRFSSMSMMYPPFRPRLKWMIDMMLKYF
ncbi:MAG: aldehyde dehydrogenase family protein [Cyclobacteriaceae bacterium]|nr:aldehyde dehydrogenase family protein [Cyclobacteriaceae bacterium]